MTVFAKILSTIGLIMLYGLLNGMVILASGKGPSMVGIILAIGFFAGLIAIWRSKAAKSINSNQLDKTNNDPI